MEKLIKSRMQYTNGYWIYKFNNGSDICLAGKKTSNPIKLLKCSGAFEDVVADLQYN